MKPWKKAVLVFLSLLTMILCIAGCGQEKKQDSMNQEHQEITSTMENDADKLPQQETEPQNNEDQSVEEEIDEQTIIDGDED